MIKMAFKSFGNSIVKSKVSAVYSAMAVIISTPTPDLVVRVVDLEHAA